MVVVLPAPLGPTSPVTLPRGTIQSTPATATVSPYRLVKPSQRTAASSAARRLVSTNAAPSFVPETRLIFRTRLFVAALGPRLGRPANRRRHRREHLLVGKPKRPRLGQHHIHDPLQAAPAFIHRHRRHLARLDKGPPSRRRLD